MPPINKFNYLRTQLEDRALKTIEGLDLTNANYETAITLLRKRYGKKPMVLDPHYTHLMDLAQASNSTSSLRATYNAVGKCCLYNRLGKISITDKSLQSYEQNCLRW